MWTKKLLHVVDLYRETVVSSWHCTVQKCQNEMFLILFVSDHTFSKVVIILKNKVLVCNFEQWWLKPLCVKKKLKPLIIPRPFKNSYFGLHCEVLGICFSGSSFWCVRIVWHIVTKCGRLYNTLYLEFAGWLDCSWRYEQYGLRTRGTTIVCLVCVCISKVTNVTS